jgi:hypothetical protein
MLWCLIVVVVKMEEYEKALIVGAAIAIIGMIVMYVMGLLSLTSTSNY